MDTTNRNERVLGYICLAMVVGSVMAVPMCAWLWPGAGLLTQVQIGVVVASVAVWTFALVAGVLGTAWQAYWRMGPLPQRGEGMEIEAEQLSWD